MRFFYRAFAVAFLLLLPSLSNGQVLITLVFGEALNTPNIEFGLAGGMNRSFINTISESEGMNSFDLGFYFHVLLKNSSYISTGVHVKSTVGATGMPTYPIGDDDFDDLYKNGTLTKKIPTFYVPILFQQRFHNNRWYIELGPQVGLNHKPTDVFKTTLDGGELVYTLEVQDQYKRIDAGFAGGVGYKFKKVIKSMSAGINYYYGLVDVSKSPDLSIKNSALNFYLKIPIGLAKKE